MSQLLQQFNPTNYQPIWCWLTTQRNITTVSDKVSTWITVANQVAPNGYNGPSSFRMTTVGSRPFLTGDTYNGYPVINFNTGSTNWLTNDVVTLIAQPATFFIVAKIPVWPTSQSYLLGSRSSTETHIRMITSAGVKSISLRVGGSTVKTVTDTNYIKENKWAVYILSVTSATTTSFFTVNDNPNLSISSVSNSPSGFNLGSRFTGPSLNLTFDLAEMIVYSGAVSSNLQTHTYNYLREKYNITP